MKKNFIRMFLVLMALTCSYAQSPEQEMEKQIDGIIASMTLTEKAQLLSGDVSGFDSKPLPRLGIPALKMTDGPNGVRWGASTAFPVGVCMAATWDPDLVREMARAIGQEAKAKGRNVLLGPCVNIHRDPHAGRNFESFGEDPYLAARMAVAYVQGMQSEQVMATTKHFAVNNQEFERNSMDSHVSERVLREIYFPAFKAAVQEGGSWAVMSSYNRVNGQYASSNTWLLKKILKEEWGFQGFVMSDWGAVHSIVPTLYAGLDIEMPTGRYLKEENVVEAIHEGRMKESKVDDKVRRILRAMLAMDLFSNEVPPGGALHTPEHIAIALEVAESGIVLLKNETQLLPLNDQTISSIAVIGPNATKLRTGGGGSSRVDPMEAISPLDALQKIAGTVQINYAPGMLIPGDLDIIPEQYLSSENGESGLKGEYFDNPDFSGTPIFTQVDKQLDFSWGQQAPAGLQKDNFSIRWTGRLAVPESGKYTLGVTSDDGSRVILNGKEVILNWGDHAMESQTAQVELLKDQPVEIVVELYEHRGDAGLQLQWKLSQGSPLEEAVQAARVSDVALLFMGFSERDESEGHDRESNALPDEQIELINRVCAVNDRVVVVFNSGSGILMHDWGSRVPAILETWYPGEQGGIAIANILMGRVNPSGKLVTTFFQQDTDTPTYHNYPGQDDELNYEEGLFVGYRHYDKYRIQPSFPFGHGLSYTDFEYSQLTITPRKVKADESVQVSLKIKNTGVRAGAEVVQLYLGDDKASLIRPLRELKAFSKVFLEPGEERTVILTLQPDALKYWDPGSAAWMAEAGRFTVYVGSSSRDIRLSGSFRLK